MARRSAGSGDRDDTTTGHVSLGPLSTLLLRMAVPAFQAACRGFEPRLPLQPPPWYLAAAYHGRVIEQRPFGRTGRSVSELGVGMWGMGGGIGGWTGADDRQSMEVLQAAVDAGITFFDSAQVYGYGHTDRLLGELVRANPGSELFVASKVPPKDRQWPAQPGARLRDAFPPDHVRASVDGMLRQLQVETIDLVQFHVWQDAWFDDPGWQRAVEELRRDGRVRHVGISVNRREPANVLRTLRTGLVDAVQVVYNVFDQAPEDELFPACRELGVAVIARVPLDEGSLTGMLTMDSRWPDGDWRNTYFSPATLAATVPRVEALRPLVPEGQSMAQLALRFILSNPDVTTVIPGTRKPEHLAANVAAADAGPLPAKLLAALREHRWDRPQSRASQS
jgi:aryl-alcohol dehydrogenase-like predicted oxidoreductase